MSFILRVGLPRSTKTYAMVDSMLNVLQRNKKWYENKKTKDKRQVYTNLNLSEDIKKKYSGYINFFRTEKEFQNVIDNVTDSDLFIDEISIFYDADAYATIPTSYKVFLTQYAKVGNTIEATTQDASQLYTRARRKLTAIYHHVKIVGNSSPSPTRPKIKFIWGMYFIFSARFIMSAEGELELKSGIFPTPHFIYKDVVRAYDTRQKIEKMKFQVVEHYEYRCPTCDYKKVVHK